MTQVMEISRAPARAVDTRVIGLVGSAHFASHYFILLLPPLFPFIQGAYGVSYTELGLALAAFNVVSAVLQTPAGLLTDRIGATTMLFAGLLCSALAFGLAAAVPSFWFLVAMFGLAGLGNTVYHPADYAILSRRVPPERMGFAYSFHTFSGMLGNAVAPAALLLLERPFGWRGAFLSAALLGIVVAGVVLLQRSVLAGPETQAVPRRQRQRAEWRLLVSAPLVRNLILYIMLALVGGGLQNYSVVALVALHHTPLIVADVALTCHLLAVALGVLLGGLIAARTSRHDLVASIGLVIVALVVVPIALLDPGSAALVGAMSTAGLFSGLIMPSRDMIVRQMTPAGAFGTVFGFVTTGFNIGGIVAPLLFGSLMDHGHPQAIFLLSAVFCLVSVLVLAGTPRRLGARTA